MRIPTLTMIVVACLLAGSAAQEPGAAGEKGPVPDISPEMKERIIQKKMDQAKALARLAKEKTAARDRIKDGPCMCGAASHKKCSTPGVCEPKEQKMMDLLDMQARQANAKLGILLGQLPDIKAEENAGKALARLRGQDLKKEMRQTLKLRDLLQKELEKVQARPALDLRSQLSAVRLQLTTMETLSLYKEISDELMLALPAKHRDTAKEINAAVVAALEARASGDQAKMLSALSRAMNLAKLGLANLAGLDKGSKKALGFIHNAYAVIISLGEAHEEWNREHDVKKLARRGLDLATDIAGMAPDPRAKALATTFQTSQAVTSAAIVIWHVGETARAVQLNFDMKQDAQVFLLKKINGLNTRMYFQKRRLRELEASGAE